MSSAKKQQIRKLKRALKDIEIPVSFEKIIELIDMKISPQDKMPSND